MTKRYARIAPAQVQKAVNGLDTLLLDTPLIFQSTRSPSAAKTLPENSKKLLSPLN